MTVKTLDPQEVKSMIDAGEKFVLLDVRENRERAASRIEPSAHIPLGELAKRAQELDRNERIVTYCLAGVRSLNAANWLIHNGFTNVQSMRGGIERWAKEIAPTQ